MVQKFEESARDALRLSNNCANHRYWLGDSFCWVNHSTVASPHLIKHLIKEVVGQAT